MQKNLNLTVGLSAFIFSYGQGKGSDVVVDSVAVVVEDKVEVKLLVALVEDA